MGIVKFKKVINKHKVDFKTDNLENIVSLFIDTNGIFHKAKGEVYKTARNDKNNYIYPQKERDIVAKMDKEKLEKKHIKFIIDDLTAILKKFKPTGTLILAPDGMAPAAKMQQQKERRYGFNPEEDKLFMGASISPGTPFMMKLDLEIKKWLTKGGDIFPKKTIYSSHLCPGEGEHKIFDFIRSHSLSTSKGRHVIYGADGDLFIISLFSPLRNLYLFDENRSKYYHIDKLRKCITVDMRYDFSKTYDIDPQLIRDFCFLTFLLGNDFLHRFPSLFDTQTSMVILINVYKENMKPLTSKEHKIRWPNLLSFFKVLRDYKIGKYDLYTFSVHHTQTQYMNKDWVAYPETVESVELYDLEGDHLEDINYDPSKHRIKFNLRKFSKLWYNKQFVPQELRLKEMYPDGKYYGEKDVSNMCKYYLKMLQWCLYYYNFGDKAINKMIFYPYNFTPLLESVINYLEFALNSKDESLYKGILSNSDYLLTPVQGLMLILPPANKSLIPEPFRSLYSEKLGSLTPVEFQTLPKEGTDADHVKIKLIPPINPFLVYKVVKESGYKIGQEFNIEKPLILVKEKTIDNENLGLYIESKNLL